MSDLRETGPTPEQLDAAESAVEKFLDVNPETYLLRPSGRPVKASEIVRIALDAALADYLTEEDR